MHICSCLGNKVFSCLALVTVGKGGGFLMGRQSHIKVLPEHISVVPLFQPWPS